MRVVLWIPLCAVGVFTVGCSDKPSTSGLNGAWKPVMMEIEGQELPADEVAANPTILEISDLQVMLKVGDRVVGQGAADIDWSKRPKTMKLHGVNTGGGQKGTQGGSVGIFEVNADTLRYAFTAEGGKPPSEFKSSPGSRVAVITYRRVR